MSNEIEVEYTKGQRWGYDSCSTKFRVSKLRHKDVYGVSAATQGGSNGAVPRAYANFAGTAQEVWCEGLADLKKLLIEASEDEAIATGLVHRNNKYIPECHLQWHKDSDFAYRCPRWIETREEMFKCRYQEPALFVFSAIGPIHAAESIWAELCVMDESLVDVGYLQISRPYDESTNSTLRCNVIREHTAKFNIANPFLYEFCCIADRGKQLKDYRKKLIWRFSDSWDRMTDNVIPRSGKSEAITTMDGLYPGYILNPLSSDDSEVTYVLRSGGPLHASSFRGVGYVAAMC